jgi:hypothetical protein
MTAYEKLSKDQLSHREDGRTWRPYRDLDVDLKARLGQSIMLLSFMIVRTMSVLSSE